MSVCMCLCVSMHACVCVLACADPIIIMFVPGVVHGFLPVFTSTQELSEDMYLNTAVIITYFTTHVLLSLLINDFTQYAAIVKCIALIAVYALYKSPLLL